MADSAIDERNRQRQQRVLDRRNEKLPGHRGTPETPPPVPGPREPDGTPPRSPGAMSVSPSPQDVPMPPLPPPPPTPPSPALGQPPPPPAPPVSLSPFRGTFAQPGSIGAAPFFQRGVAGADTTGRLGAGSPFAAEGGLGGPAPEEEFIRQLLLSLSGGGAPGGGQL